MMPDTVPPALPLPPVTKPLLVILAKNPPIPQAWLMKPALPTVTWPLLMMVTFWRPPFEMPTARSLGAMALPTLIEPLLTILALLPAEKMPAACPPLASPSVIEPLLVRLFPVPAADAALNPVPLLPAVMPPPLVSVLLLPLTRTPVEPVPRLRAPLLVIWLVLLRLMAVALLPSVMVAPGCTLTVTLFWVPLPTPVTSAPVQVTVTPSDAGGAQAASAGLALDSSKPAKASTAAMELFLTDPSHRKIVANIISAPNGRTLKGRA